MKLTLVAIWFIGFMIAMTASAKASPAECNGTIRRSVCEAIRHHTKHPEWANDKYLARLIKHESGGILCAVNPRRIDCSYRGRNACGLFQLNPCRCFPELVKQVRCGIRYIELRYKSPYMAIIFWNRNGSY